ncbi:hypothetical protein [Streptomyces sp. MBT84]|uniref:hypothetical protein n=1 Tax=Streptomyces sp. MBT84 TaxID=1488414 RepID=UPI001C6EECC9|nr:hypothetical protein [Streptomyces sp. MBT84]
MAYEPLHGPGDKELEVSSLSVEIACTRQILAETAPLNIHDHSEMLSAAVKLDIRVRNLLAAIEAERGEAR